MKAMQLVRWLFRRKLQFFILAICLLTGFFLISERAASTRRYHFIALGQRPNLMDKLFHRAPRTSLIAFDATSANTKVLYAFPERIHPSSVAYAPAEKQIYVSAYNLLEERCEVEVFDIQGALIKTIPIAGGDNGDVSRPYYHQGRLILCRPEEVISIDSHQTLERHSIRETFPKPVHELLQNYERNIVPDRSYTEFLLCYAPLTRTRRGGASGWMTSDPHYGRLYVYRTGEKRLVATPYSGYDLSPAHGASILLYTPDQRGGMHVDTLNEQLQRIGAFTILSGGNHRPKWSTSDTQIGLMADNSIDVYNWSSGKRIKSVSIGFTPIDWDWLSDL